MSNWMNQRPKYPPDPSDLYKELLDQQDALAEQEEDDIPLGERIDEVH